MAQKPPGSGSFAVAAARLAWFHSAMSQTNRLVLRRPQPTALFDASCRIWVTAGHADLAVVDLLEDEGTERVALWQARHEQADSKAAWSHVNSAEVRQPLTLLAMRCGKLEFSNDAPNDPRLVGWQRWCTVRGIRSVAALPLKRAGVCIGVLLLMMKTPNFFDDALAELLREAAQDLSFAVDNSDREHALQAALGSAEKSRQLFETLFHAAPIPMALLHVADQAIVVVNDRWCAELHISREESVGKTTQQLGLELSDGAQQVFYEALRTHGSVVAQQAQLRLRSGEWRDVLLHAECVEYLDTPCALVVTTDVSDVGAARIAERAQAVAEEANRVKNEFLAQMSHELRTPLNAVLGFAQLLTADVTTALSPRQSEWVRLISQAGWHLLALVEDVLDLSRIESGRLDVVVSCVDVSHLLDEVISLSGPLASAQRIELRWQFGTAGTAGAIGAIADARRLRQVLINVLSNAIKYNRSDGTVRVTASVCAQTVIVDVQDTGAGLSGEQLAHLFEPFNRLGHENGPIEGAGIGLALSRKLVELMGGRLDVSSVLGVGTCVRMQLAACDPLPAAVAVAAGPAYDRRAPAGVVLSIEDNPVNQMVVEQMLLPWEGVQLLQAVNGSEGIATAVQRQPDLILLDMQLPDMSGFDVLQALKGDARTSALRVVCLSASAMPQDMEMARRLGALEYWTKPLVMDTFVARVAALLSP